MARGGALRLSATAAYIAERTGSSLSAQQLERLEQGILGRRGQRSEKEFLDHLRSPAGAADLAELMAVISVHKTDLFRDEVQLAAFEEHVLRPLARASSRPLHLWSAGCATGEEVATLLVLLHEARAHSHSTVLGTDIADVALRQARELRFHPSTMRRVPQAIRESYFRQQGGAWELLPELRQRASFARHNLMDRPYPIAANGQGFDVIFCRNVLIYVTEDATAAVVDTLARQLKPGGTLVLSAAEPLLRPHPLLATVRFDQAFFYLRRDAEERAPAVPPRVTPPPPPRHRTPLPPPRVLQAQEIPPPVEEDPREEASRIFELVLEWAAAGDNPSQTEQGLRKCVYLDPHFAQARYLLGTLLEQRGEKADAASEYRRALAALKEGKARQTPFFLNEDRLQQACAKALQRLGYRPSGTFMAPGARGG